MIKEIGGYFELELKEQYDNIGSSVALNCARNCLRYVIKAFDIKEIYLPFYTCPVVWQSVQKENCKIKFYHIDENFYPVQSFPENAYILYTNYFGINAKNVKSLATEYKNLIIDNSQAFYMPEYGIASFNSIRKFFGVPDGALLHCDRNLNIQFEKDTSYQRSSHLLKRLDVSAQYGYQDFCNNDDSLIDEEIKTISNLTKALFNTIDVQKAKEKRIENFEILSSALSSTNRLNIELDVDDVPMCYPYMTDKAPDLRKTLINNKIYIPIYWNNLSKETFEYILRNNILPLPVDQRYSKKDMQQILNILQK